MGNVTVGTVVDRPSHSVGCVGAFLADRGRGSYITSVDLVEVEEVTAIESLGWRTAADGWHIQWDFRGPAKLILRWGADGVLQSQTGGEIEVSCLRREIRRFLREHAGEQLAMVMEVER